jgi:hypothetical protein
VVYTRQFSDLFPLTQVITSSSPLQSYADGTKHFIINLSNDEQIHFFLSFVPDSSFGSYLQLGDPPGRQVALSMTRIGKKEGKD